MEKTHNYLLLPQRKLKDLFNSDPSLRREFMYSREATMASFEPSIDHFSETAFFQSPEIRKKTEVIPSPLNPIFENSKVAGLILSFLDFRDIVAIVQTCTSHNDQIIREIKNVKLSAKQLISYLAVVTCSEFEYLSTDGILSGCTISCSGLPKLLNKDCQQFLNCCKPEALANAPHVISFSCCFDAAIDEVCFQPFFDGIAMMMGENLIHLDLEGSVIGAHGIFALCESLRSLKLSKLVTLNLNRNNGTSEGLRRLISRIVDRCCPYLEQLELNNNLGRIAALEVLELSTKCSLKLRHLDLSSNLIDTMDSESVALFSRQKMDIQHCCYLDLSFNPIGDDGLTNLFKVFCPVNLDQNNVPIKKGGKTLSLHTLRLDSCEMGNLSMAYLSSIIAAGRMNELRVLSVNMNRIGTLGIEALLNVLSKHDQELYLKELSLHLNDIGNEGVNKFASQLVSGLFEKLEILDIADVGATASTMHKLARAMAVMTDGIPVRVKNLKILKLFGRLPDANKSAHTIFSSAFLNRVEVS